MILKNGHVIPCYRSHHPKGFNYVSSELFHFIGKYCVSLKDWSHSCISFYVSILLNKLKSEFKIDKVNNVILIFMFIVSDVCKIGMNFFEL